MFQNGLTLTIKTDHNTKITSSYMGLYSAGLIVGRIFAPFFFGGGEGGGGLFLRLIFFFKGVQERLNSLLGGVMIEFYGNTRQVCFDIILSCALEVSKYA